LPSENSDGTPNVFIDNTGLSNTFSPEQVRDKGEVKFPLSRT
jgi:hypothetical protein